MTQHLRLIFVHTPKCGGTSIRAAVVEHFSPASVLEDYHDRITDPRSEMNIDPQRFLARWRQRSDLVLEGKLAVVGHFWIAKYQGVAADVRATILREPISRAISQYFFWQRAPISGHSLHNYVLENQLSFLEFASLPAVNTLYTNILFRNVDMAEFDIIVTYEKLSRDWQGTLTDLGMKPMTPRYLNATEDQDPQYLAKRSEIINDSHMMAQLRELFASDLRFYERYVSSPNSE